MSNLTAALFGFVCMLIIAAMLYCKAQQANDDWPDGGT